MTQTGCQLEAPNQSSKFATLAELEALIVSRFSSSRHFIDSKPRFRLTRPALPSDLRGGQMTIVFESLLAVYPACLALDELVKSCEKREYRARFRNPKTNIHKSMLYHLNRIDAAQQCSN